MDKAGIAKKLGILYTIMIFLAISWGGYVRAMGAGLGCGPDWPLCNGYVIPPDLFTDLQVFLEYFHRVIAFTTGIVAFVSTIFIFRYFSGYKKVIYTLALTDILLIAQILLGMLVVFLHLDPILSATHLTLATLTFGVSILFALSTWELESSK